MSKDFVAYGLGRSRDDRGKVKNWHINPYVNCITTLVGGGHLMTSGNMVLIVKKKGVANGGKGKI